MLTKTLPDLLEGWANDVPAVSLSGISLDDRTIRAGEAFIAVQGHVGHGLDRARFAVAAGAVAVIHDGLQVVPELGVPSVMVRGLGHRLGELASRYYSAPSELLNIAAVTGTNGKTSVAHFLAQSWQRVYGNAGLMGKLGYGPVGQLQNGGHTTANALRVQQMLSACVNRDVEHLAMEVSARALQQQSIQTVQINAAILTDLSRDHLDDHTGMAGYAATKRLLFTEYAPSFAIINHDDEYGRKWFAELNGGMQMLSFGLTPGAELTAQVRSMDMHGMVLRINGPWGADEVRTSLAGVVNASSLLATAGTLAILGMPWHRVLHQLELMQPVPGSMIHAAGQQHHHDVSVDDTDTLDALENAA